MIWFALLLAAVSVLTSCGSSTKVFVHSDIQNYRLERIAVMPFTEDDRQKEEPLKSQRIEKGAGEKLTLIFYDALKVKPGILTIPLEDVTRITSGIVSREGGLPQKTLAVKVAKEAGADAVIIGRVDIFQERIGSPFGISRPASVGFEVELYSVSDGELLWRSGFYETQASLTEDIGSLPLFIMRGGKWITAEELSRYGAGEVVKKYPDGRK